MSSKVAKTERFLGWQSTPIHQASFGSSTKGGKQNQNFKVKFSTGPIQEMNPDWFVLDASELPIGRVASVAANILMGKHKPTFTPGAGSGDSVIILNADKAFFTSNKDEKKIYYRHSGYIGGLKMETAGEALQKHPEKVLYEAVRGMMPKNRLSRYQLSRLKIYKGTEHSHAAQKPKKVDLKAKGILKNLGEVK